MTSRYHGDGDCSWREDERRRAPGTEGAREGERMSNIDREKEREPNRVQQRPRWEKRQYTLGKTQSSCMFCVV